MDAGQSLQHEVAPFGISTTIVNPGIFRTELLTTESVTYVESSLEDYADHTAEHLKSWDALNGQEAGDPAKLAQALLTIAGQERPPRRFIAGTDGIGFAEQKVADLQQQIEAFRDLSTSLAHGAEAAAA
jgi:NAD(P)-dependent dehydrogenase (short-subunit alcohol dehydrogenase family)